jgi:dipeptidyl aminopeptidase/acylaminoacyl peptidase
VRYPIMHWLKPTPDVEWAIVGRTGVKSEYYVIDVDSKKQVRLDSAARMAVRGWRPDGSELLMTWFGDQKVDLVAASRKTGASRTIFAETTKTFLDVNLTLPNSPNLTLLADNRRFLWLSERDGWNQIYLFNLDGALIRQLTVERCPVERIVAVDEKDGWVYYTAHGGAGRPYDLHLYRVSLAGGRADGSKATRLTEAIGQHDVPVYQGYLGDSGAGIQFSPSRRFFLDTHSDIDRPPQTELRRADGTLVEVIERAEAAEVSALAPNPPEEFTAKAADGQTDLYGVLYKPYDFDPNKNYPVVDFIYAAPYQTRVPRTFANLGLIVFVVDARGTPDRGKAFQDVAYRNIGRNEIPDHVAVLKQLAAARRYIDMNRAGVIGGSFGGYFATRAMLQAPDVFQAGIALAPMMDLSAGLDLWMGKPEENPEGYEFGSNLPIAANLKGHLLLIHGTSDTNSPFAGTMRLIDALERADKPYDLVVLPEKDHSAQNSMYSLQAVKRYLTEHLKL